MSTLRKLSVIYLLCASVFGVAIAFDRDPALAHASRAAVGSMLAATRTYVAEPAFHLAREGANHLVAVINDPRVPAGRTRTAPKPVAPLDQARVQNPPAKAPAPVSPRRVAPAAPVTTVPELAAERAPRFVRITPRLQIEPMIALVPPPALPATARVSLAPAELVRVTLRMKENLTHEMLENFGLFLYVSKADNGPWAQRLYVFRKDAGGNLAMLYNWSASTGREKDEIAPNGTHQPSYTPRGYYELDPNRMYRNHFSGQWHEPMPHAMFFNWENNGYQTGLAIHGATGLELAQLGSRASAGCIRIAPENARLLFGLIRAEYKGLAPRFAFDRRTATMSNDGVLMHDPAGNLRMADGYKVLVFIENYGGENVVAALF